MYALEFVLNKVVSLSTYLQVTSRSSYCFCSVSAHKFSVQKQRYFLLSFLLNTNFSYIEMYVMEYFLKKVTNIGLRLECIALTV